MRQQSFFAELQRRHVYKVGAMYAVAGWLLAQVVTQILPVFNVSLLGQRILVLALIAGFPLALVLAWLFDVTPQGIVGTDALPAEGEAPETLRERRGMDRKLNYVLGMLVIVGIGYVVVEHTLFKTAGTSTAAVDKSIAVLPFENLSEEKSNAYFAVGIQDEILTRLAKISALKVISRTSTMHYASSPDNLPEIARQLGVAHILEGSVQRSGDQVRITVQLILASTDAHLWAETYDRKLTDIFSIQSEVAKAIAAALQATLTSGEKTEIASQPTRNTKAYEAYLRGLALEGRYSASTDDTRKRIEAYQTAVDLDPDFAQAWGLLSRANTELYFQTDTTPERLAQAKHALDRATRLAPDASETKEGLGMYQYYGLGDYDLAFEAYSAALKAKPNAGSILYSMGNVRRRQGRWVEAVALQAQACDLDPLNTQTWFNLGLTLRGLRRYDEAMQAFDRGLAALPGDPALMAEKVLTEQTRGNLAAAAVLAEQLPLESDDPQVVLTRTDQWIYERQYARAIADLNQVMQRRDRLDPSLLTRLLGQLGRAEFLNKDRDAAIAHMTEGLNRLEAARAAGNSSPWDCLALSSFTAALGDSNAAQHYIELGLAGLAHDAIGLPQIKAVQAYVLLQAGDKTAALAVLAEALALPTPYGLSPAILRISPDFDGLRGDARLEKLIAGGEAAAKLPMKL